MASSKEHVRCDTIPAQIPQVSLQPNQPGSIQPEIQHRIASGSGVKAVTVESTRVPYASVGSVAARHREEESTPDVYWPM